MSNFSFSDAIITYVVFLYSTVVHEAAHAWTGWRLGDDTAYRGGQVSLDPTPHIKREPIGMVVVPLPVAFSRRLGGRLGQRALRSNVGTPSPAAFRADGDGRADLEPGDASARRAGIRLGIATGGFEPPRAISWSQMVSPVGDGAMWGFGATLLSIVFSLICCWPYSTCCRFRRSMGAPYRCFFCAARPVDTYLNFIQQPNFGLIGLLISWQAFRWVIRRFG